MKSPPKDRDYWNLGHFIPIAVELTWITPATAKAADLARDFRNLIHPAAAQRVGHPCDRGTAHQALAAVYQVERDLRTQAPTRAGGCLCEAS